MIPVVLESPYGTNPDGTRADAATIARRVRYAEAAMAYLLSQGFAPFPSHLLYTRVLRDDVPEQRAIGLRAGFAVGSLMRRRVFAVDEGWTNGMRLGHDEAIRLGQAITHIRVPGWAP